MEKKIFISLALATFIGVVVLFAVLPSSSIPTSRNLLASNVNNFLFSEEDDAFIEFIQTYKKSYLSKEEFNARKQVFTSNYRIINEHNQNPERTFDMAVNSIADLTLDEFKDKYLGLSYPLDVPRNEISLSTDNLPESVDWNKKGMVSKVKNQGSCGSCWAFSAIGSLESANALKTGKVTEFSEQQLVDCSGDYDNQGCNGGLMDNAFKYIEEKGIATEESYPYTGRAGACKANETDTQLKITGYSDVPEEDNDQLKAAVAKQPVSVAVSAGNIAFQFYHKGVISILCGTKLDHGVLATGYDTTSSNKPYWIVKNSWGAGWGNSGYVYIKRTDGKSKGTCGIAMAASYPTF